MNRWFNFGSAIKIFPGLEHVYVSDSFSGLRVINPESGASPGFIDLNIDPRTVAETPDHLFVAGSNKGLLIVDKNALLSRQVVKTINTLGSARDLYIKNRWLYVADDQGGVVMHNLDSGGVTIPLSAHMGKSFTVSGNILFVAEGKQGVEAFDITNPGHPKAVVDWPSLWSLRLAIVDDYLLSANGASGVELFDISDIQNPVHKDILSAVHVLDIVSDDQLIFIASRDEGLLIYEITENSKFNRLSQLSTPFPMNQFDLAIAVYVQNGIAYVANGRSGLLIVDVTKPREPVILSSIDIQGICKQVRVVDGKAFVTSHHGGISIVNVEDLQNPSLLNSISMPGLSRGLQVVDDLLYVTHN
ncbi:MAG: hypothetical protein KAG92_03535, partial [Deltaproteobacteria bacterium]|nr:hypothetical protein [Deltaproteobacteria bacterium]